MLMSTVCHVKLRTPSVLHSVSEPHGKCGTELTLRLPIIGPGGFVTSKGTYTYDMSPNRSVPFPCKFCTNPYAIWSFWNWRFLTTTVARFHVFVQIFAQIGNLLYKMVEIVNGSRYYRGLESVSMIASALPFTHARSESINADSLNSNFLQLRRRSGGRPQRTVHLCPHSDTHYFSRPRTHRTIVGPTRYTGSATDSPKMFVQCMSAILNFKCWCYKYSL